MIWHKLTKAEQRLAEYLALSRFNYNRAKGSKATNYTGQSQISVDTNADAAEISYCAILNVYPDMNFEHHPDEDCITAHGYTVDVKWSSRPDGQLLVKEEKIHKPCDFYALMIGKWPIYGLVGHASAAQLFRDENLIPFANHKNYVLDQSLLGPCVCINCLREQHEYPEAA